MGQQAAQVSLPSDREVEVTRTFRAPRKLVYEAYTKPELMRRWLLGPPGWTMPVCEMDVRVGGRFRWRWRSDEDGKEFGFEGEYLDVQPAALLRNTESFDSGDIGGSMGEKPAVVTVRFDERSGTTTLTTLIEYASKEDRDAAMSTGMTDGMESSYKLLDELLAKKEVQGKPA
jgi:uncharacterized protein YndB with AHSA1/START domain